MASAELAVRATNHRLPPPLEWYHELAQLKADQLTKRGGGGTVYIGTSATMRGIDPSRIPAGGYNAAVPDARPRLLEMWLDDAVLANGLPTRVVYGIQSLDLKALDSDSLALYRAARATSAGRWKRVERRARVFDIVRYRPVLRSGGQLVQAVRGRPSSIQTQAKGLQPDGYAPLTGAQLLLDRSKLSKLGYRRSVERRVLADVDEQEVAALGRIVARLRRLKIDLVLVGMPVPERYWDLVPGASQSRDHDRFRRLLGDFGVRVVDLSGRLTDDRLYADFVHLTPDGARRASDLLRDELVNVPSRLQR